MFRTVYRKDSSDEVEGCCALSTSNATETHLPWRLHHRNALTKPISENLGNCLISWQALFYCSMPISSIYDCQSNRCLLCLLLWTTSTYLTSPASRGPLFRSLLVSSLLSLLLWLLLLWLFQPEKRQLKRSISSRLFYASYKSLFLW